MQNPFQIQRELRYGAPVCDEILVNRYFTIGYSWYFRQAKWTLEIVNRERPLLSEVFGDVETVERSDNFRADTRIPKRFRAGLKAYRGNGYDRGHLVGSANQNLLEIQNSETFLLSNMAPQAPALNRGRWRQLEQAIVEVDAPGQNQTFTHEIGHLFGGQHQDQETRWPRGQDNVARYAFPHRWKHDIFSLRRASIMWTNPGNRGNELRFSNPDLWSASERTGVEGTRDMAQQLRDQAATVAAYVNVPRLAASISGPRSLSPYARGTFRANVSNCGGGATYRWEQADDGRSYRFVGSSSSVSIRAGNTYSTTLRLRVTCGGQTVTAFRTVIVGGGSGCGSDIICLTGGEGLPDGDPVGASVEDARAGAPTTNPLANGDEPFGVRLHPNPLSGYRVGLTFLGKAPDATEVTVRDLVTGRTVHSAQFPTGTTGTLELKLPALTPGSYAVTCSSGGRRETHHLTITHQ